MFAHALGGDAKGKISALSYTMAVALAFVTHWIADALYVLVARMWLIPDKRFARIARQANHDTPGS